MAQSSSLLRSLTEQRVSGILVPLLLPLLAPDTINLVSEMETASPITRFVFPGADEKEEDDGRMGPIGGGGRRAEILTR